MPFITAPSGAFNSEITNYPVPNPGVVQGKANSPALISSLCSMLMLWAQG